MSDTSKTRTSLNFSWEARASSAFVLGLSVGVLIGFAVSAPLLGWHLPPGASAVLSAFLGGVAGVAGAVLIWRLQEQSQRRSIRHLVMIGLTTLDKSAENVAKGYGNVQEPKAIFMIINTSLRADLYAYADMWSGLGIHQSAFSIAVSLELVALKRHVDTLIHELQLFDARRADALVPVDANSVFAKLLVGFIARHAGSAIKALSR